MFLHLLFKKNKKIVQLSSGVAYTGKKEREIKILPILIQVYNRRRHDSKLSISM